MNTIEKIRAEIERLKGQLIRGACAAQIEMKTNCKEEAYDEVLSFLSTLESEKPILNDLEEAANEYAYRGIPDKLKQQIKPIADEISKNFIAGAEWQKEQMLKDAVEGDVVKDISNKLAVTAKINLDGFKFGDKVRVIVLPKEDEK